MPGRPVKLNQYSRGYLFTSVAFNAETPEDSLKLPLKPIVFVASSKGTLFKVDPISEQIICGYQLHSGSICSLIVQGKFKIRCIEC